MISSDNLSSESTSIRFVFTVGSLNYSRVGFVFSKTDPDPTVGGDGCHVYETTSVYSSIWANGVKTAAPDGRYWVAVKVTGIPNADFATAIQLHQDRGHEQRDPFGGGQLDVWAGGGCDADHHGGGARA